jgi:hypothetical protein
MRLTLTVALAILTVGCRRPSTPPVSASSAAPQQCTYEIVQPDTSATAKAFRDWLKPQADDLFGGSGPVDNGDVFIADVDNDGSNDVLFAWTEGSGSFLNALVFRRAADTWVPVNPSPLEDRLEASHYYAGPLMTEPQLVARVCGKTIINLAGGSEPNYYPESFVWQGNTVTPVCNATWATRHRAAAADLVKRGLLDEAHVLLDGVRQACKEISPPEVAAIKEDIARIVAATTAASAATYDFSWLMREVKTHPDNQLVIDPRFSPMLVTIVPDAQLEHESLRGALKKSVWLPDDPKIIDDRYIVISGCEPHNCGNKGLIWIDLATKQAIAMTNGTLASKTTNPSKIPMTFWEHTLDAVGEWPEEGIDFIGPDGKTTTVKAP